MENTELIILAGGKGTRMNNDKPKCLTEIKGKPMIERLLNNIESILINKPIVVVGYKSEEVMNYLGERARYAFQAEQKGTAHALSIALKHLMPSTENIIVLYGDQPFIGPLSVNKLNDSLINNKISIAISDGEDFSNWKSILNQYGRIIYNNNKEIVDIIEYKDANEEIRKLSLVNSGCYAFKRDWIINSINNIKSNNIQKEYYLTDIVKVAKENSLPIGSVIIDPFEALGLNSQMDIKLIDNLI